MRRFVRRDLDGFFGLFVDNVVQLLLMVALCGGLCGMTGEDGRLLFGMILPGAAVSILIGNLFYAWQARRLALREGCGVRRRRGKPVRVGRQVRACYSVPAGFGCFRRPA